jgi:hypothetical protein
VEILQEVDGYFSSVAEKQLGEIIVLLPVLYVGNGQKFWQVPSFTRHNNSLTAASTAQLLVAFVACVYVCVCVCVCDNLTLSQDFIVTPSCSNVLKKKSAIRFS